MDIIVLYIIILLQIVVLIYIALNDIKKNLLIAIKQYINKIAFFRRIIILLIELNDHMILLNIHRNILILKL